jgi:hypothetical protein
MDSLIDRSTNFHTSCKNLCRRVEQNVQDYLIAGNKTEASTRQTFHHSHDMQRDRPRFQQRAAPIRTFVVN